MKDHEYHAENIDQQPQMAAFGGGELRAQAERHLEGQAGLSAPRLADLDARDELTDTAEQLRRQFQLQQHELQVHQIELTLQNEELRRSNIKLERARRKYQELYDSAPVGYFSLDTGGHVLSANAAARAQLGIPESELLGRRLLLFLHESSRAAFADVLTTLERQMQGRLEVRLLRPDGQTLIVQLDCTYSGAAEGRLGKVRVSATDITALAEARHTIAALNETLEARVQVRTAQVQALNEELESFVRSTRQALDTPLRHIGSFAALLEMPQAEKSAERKQHYLQEVVAAARQVQTLTGALTEYFRLGRQPAYISPINLERVMAEVKKDLRAQIGERQITWTQGQLPTVSGDSRTLQLLFRNLLDNALKFTRPVAEPRIQISAQETEREYIIAVQDNGVGFNMEQQSRLFALFLHLHSARQLSDLGLGLGLASVQRIALRHGGRVWAEGQEGEGACFWVALPKDTALHT
ncbi:sensor histidine kinase [Deinococcus sp.]|uniref:sensor histidine kinase n=1 Tax=Deinococcus sp. TaxID=47478 RepID=UPI003B59F124